MARDDGNGPWGRGPENDDNPWGKKKRRSNEPDLEDIIRESQDKIKKLFPDGKQQGSGKILWFGALALVGLWLGSGIFTVDESEEAAILRFGEWTRTAGPGWNYHLPIPIETAIKQNVQRVNAFTNTQSSTQNNNNIMAGEGSLMLTGDENIADVQFVVNWRISDLGKFLFNSKSPIPTIQAGADSIVREKIAQTPIAKILSEGRAEINPQLQDRLQALVNEYDIGVQIMQVKLLKVTPPTQKVLEAYLDVQRAKADKERKKNEAIFYRNSVVPIARGEAKKMVEEAEAYKARVVADAQGETQRFLAILKEYKMNPAVTRIGFYYGTMNEVLNGATKVITDEGSSKAGVVPYLPLPELQKTQPKKEA